MGNWQPFRYAGFHDQPRTIYTTDGRKAFLLDCPFDDELDDYPPTYSIYAAPVCVLGTRRDPWPLDRDVDLTKLGEVVITREHLDPTFRELINWDVLGEFAGSPDGHRD